MMFLTKLPQNYYFPPTVTTQNTQLNPEAPEYYPNNILTPHFQNYPLSPSPYYYPPQPTIINIIYRHQLFPYNPTKPIYPMLPAPPTEYMGPTRDSEMDSSKVVRKVRRGLPRKMGRVIRPGPGMGSNCIWVKKDVMKHPLALSCHYPYGDSTSLMIRNIPVRFSRIELMELLDEHCRLENEKISATSSNDHDDEPASEFDFLYLPIDFERKGNLGYAFVNFTSWLGALRLYSSWNGQEWDNCPYKTTKVRQINCAKHQGKQELCRHFEGSVFVCETDEYLPIEISPPRNGVNGDQCKLTTIGRRKWV